MEEKLTDTCEKNMKFSGVRSRKGLILSATVLVVVTLCVSALVVTGISLHWFSGAQRSSNYDKVEKVEVIVNGRPETIKETMQYNKTANIAVFLNADGSFTIQHFSQGLEITKEADVDYCFLTPTDITADDGLLFDKYLDTVHGQQNVTAEADKPVSYDIIESPIEDTSFVPNFAVKACTDGFYWRVERESETSDNDEQDKDVIVRRKRGFFRRLARRVKKVVKKVKKVVKKVKKVVRKVVRKFRPRCSAGCQVRFGRRGLRAGCSAGCTFGKKK